MTTVRRLAGTLALALLVAACSATAGGSIGRSAAAPPASADPNLPVSHAPSDDGSGPPAPGVDDLVVPKPGQLDVHPVRMDRLQASVDGHQVVVIASWTSGVEPCYVLDTVLVRRGDHAFTITLREGRGPGDVACIEIAQRHATRIDLGDLEPGTYTIADSQGGVAPIQVTVS